MKKKILVIEEDAAILEIVSYVLTDAGYEVKPLNTWESIFEEITTFKPHAILLDIIKPSARGTEICNTIKATESTKHIPVIVFSTHPTVTKTIKEVCADDVLPKPFDIDELLNVVEANVTS